MGDELNDRIYLDVSPLPPELELYGLRVSELHGMESISTLYGFDLTVRCDKPGGLSPEGIDELMLGDVRIGFGPDALRRVHGVISSIELVSIRHPDGADATYRFEVVPHLWRATLTHRSRVFVGRSVPTILGMVLDEHGIAHEMRLTEDYRANAAPGANGAPGPELHVVQYEESDYAFLCRWMERLGIYFFFEQTEEGEVLVLTDSNRALLAAPDNPTVSHSQMATIDAPGYLTDLRRTTRVHPRAVHVRDFNWRAEARTSLVLGDAAVNPAEASAPIAERTGHGFAVHYGDHHLDDGEGARMARVRAEAWMSHKSLYSGASRNPDWAPGMTFSLTHACPEFNRDYLLTTINHTASHGAQGGHYQNTVTMLDNEHPYRPIRDTAWPRIDGVINARIDDDPENIGSAAPVDERGYYRVVMPYDYHAEVGARPSSWVRKAEPYAGARHGVHFTLHSGCEVLVAHIAGDPDRPIIVGAMPNARSISPVTRQEATRSIIRTRSGIVFDFEDDAR